MPYVERTDEEIVQAWELLALRHSGPEGSPFSYREIAAALRRGEAGMLRVFVEGHREHARSLNIDPVAMIEVVA